MRITNGFTLIELSIGLVIMSLLAAGALTVGGVMVEQQQFTGSNQRVVDAKKALADYFAVNGRLPCPAPLTTAVNAAGFGAEVNCAAGGAAPAGTSRVNGGGAFSGGAYTAGVVRIGALPVRTLGLRDNAMSDDYGNRIVYAMSEQFADVSSVAAANGAITLQDAGGNNITTAGTTNGGVFVVVGTGPDGKGGNRYQSGAATSVNCSGGLDAENCDGDIVFRDTRFNNGSGAANFFDDMIAWSPKYLMTSSSTSTSAAGSTGQVQYNSGGFLAASANFFWDIANNRLGIGTGTPPSSLSVVGGIRARQGIPSGDSTNLGYGFGADGDTGLFSPGAEVGNNGTLALFTNNTEQLRITDTGRVGIGTADPQDRLHVNGSVQIGQRTGAMTGDGWGPALFFGGSTTENSDAFYFQRHNYAADGSNLYMFLGDNVTGDDHFIIQAGGINRYLFRNDGLFNHAGVYYQYGASPTLYFMDTDHRSSMIHVNSNYFYVLRGAGVNNGAWTQYNGWWPLQLNLENNDAWLGGNTNLHGSLNMCQADWNGCFLRLSNDGYFQDRNTGWIDYFHDTNGGMRFYSPVIVHGRSSWNAQTSMEIHSPGGALQTDWPSGWGGGLATFDIVGASTYMSQNWIRSDRRYKRDIETLDHVTALDNLMRLRPVTYHWKDEKLPKNLQYGLIAQEVREILPDLVTGTETKTQRLGLNYDGLIAPLVASVQQLKQELDAVKDNDELPETTQRYERHFRVVISGVIIATALALLLLSLEVRRLRRQLGSALQQLQSL